MEVVVPDLGDFSDVEVVEVLVKAGDLIEREDPIITLETDKASLDVPSPAAGRVQELKVSAGDRVSSGDLVLLLEPQDSGEEEAEAGAAPAAAGNGEARANGGDGAAREARHGNAAREPAGGRTRPGQAGTGDAPEPDRSEQDRSEQDRSEPERTGTVHVPELGDFADVEVVEVLVAEGDEVEAEQGLIALETEKAMVEVPAPAAGTVLELRVKQGDRVSTGDEVLVMRSRGAAAPDEAPRPEPAARAAESAEPAEARAPAPHEAEEGEEPSERQRRAEAPEEGTPAAMPIDEAGFARAHASPSVRKLARELGVDLARVRGRGRKGRVKADDVKAFVKDIMVGRGEGPGAAARLPAVPEVDFASFGEIEVEPLGRIQRISGPRLHASWVNVPHVTHHEEADITELEKTRQSLKEQAEQRGIRLTPLAFIMRACVITLKEFPRLKSSLSQDGQGLVMKRYTHMGFAADTPKGLVVPVIRDADSKDVYELAGALAELSEQARAGKLKPADMQGGVFTISSLGGIGGTAFTPIINAPEVAILGVSRHQWRPVYDGAEFVPRLMLPLSLSYDHRVIDGAEAARFCAQLAKTLGEVQRLLEALPP